MGGFHPDFRPLQLRGISLFQFTDIRNFPETNSPNHHFRRSTFRSKTTILLELQRRADFCPIIAQYNYDGFSLLQFYGFTDLFWKLIPRIITSDEPHFGQKRQFCASAKGGRISARFPPTTITRAFRFSNFTALRNFLETNSPKHHFRRVTFCQKRRFCASANGGRISFRFPPTTITMGFAFPIYGSTELFGN